MTEMLPPSAKKEMRLDLIGPKIAVVGVGGAGSNAVDNMMRSGLQGVTFLVCNTDAQALSQSLCPESQRVRLGFGVTQGLGAGSCPDNGRMAAEESIEDVKQHLSGINMVFITAGMGGGTGTGAAPVIAKAAREMDILTVGVVTKPFHFEGRQRMKVAEKGIETIRECVDTLLVIPNQNLFRLATKDTTVLQAFAMADEVLYSGVRTFTDLMIKPGLVNSDFADIRTVMRNMKGKAMMGTGEARGDVRATEAAEKAIGCLLLDDVSIHGAQAVLINITGGPDLTLYDVDEAVGRIKQEVEDETMPQDAAQIIFGATFDQDLEGVIRVSVVATGIKDRQAEERSAAAASARASLSLMPGQTRQGAQLAHGPAQDGSFSATDVSSHPGTFSTLTPAAPDFGTLGSRHGDYGFAESSASYGSFALNEDSPEFGFETSGKQGHASAYPALEPERKTSFFGRMFGRRKEVRRAKEGAEVRSLYPTPPANPAPLGMPSHQVDSHSLDPLSSHSLSPHGFAHGDGFVNPVQPTPLGHPSADPMDIPAFLRNIKDGKSS